MELINQLFEEVASATVVAHHIDFPIFLFDFEVFLEDSMAVNADELLVAVYDRAHNKQWSDPAASLTAILEKSGLKGLKHYYIQTPSDTDDFGMKCWPSGLSRGVRIEKPTFVLYHKNGAAYHIFLLVACQRTKFAKKEK